MLFLPTLVFPRPGVGLEGKTAKDTAHRGAPHRRKLPIRGLFDRVRQFGAAVLGVWVD